jgi:hypothetical protein
MSLASQLSAITALKLLNSISAANTAAATSAWIAVSGYEGIVGVLINVGIITGTLDLTFDTATDNSGTGSAALTPLNGAIAQVTTGNHNGTPYIALFDARLLKGYIRVTGTIVTGPSLVSYQLIGRKKTV